MLRISMLVALLMAAAPSANAAPYDDMFLRSEERSSAYELEFAHLGEAHATRAEVRTYAATLINDHEAYSGALTSLAASKGIAIPSGMSPNDKQRLSRLAQARGANFDRAFIREARRVNSENLRIVRKEASRTADPDIRHFIEYFAEMDARHETAAIALSKNIVASKTPVVPPPPTGDDMVVVPPPSNNSMPAIASTRGDGAHDINTRTDGSAVVGRPPHNR